VTAQGRDSDEELQIAMEVCPVDCIHWVSTAQLPLLEAALARMGRVDVFLMLRNARAVGNVFDVSSTSDVSLFSSVYWS
jgi:hypothetical protein